MSPRVPTAAGLEGRRVLERGPQEAQQASSGPAVAPSPSTRPVVGGLHLGELLASLSEAGA